MTKQSKWEMVERFVTPDLPTESDGKTQYKLKVVTKQGAQVERDCTKEVYADFHRCRPDMETKCTFMLKSNEDGLVYDYAPITRPPENTLFKVELPDGSVIENFDKLVFERRVGEKEFNPTIVPSMVGMGTVEAIWDELMKAEKLLVDTKLMGRYRIFEIAQRAGKEVVTVDLGQ